MKIRDALNDKRVLLWGHGREGVSMENYIGRCCSVKSLAVYEGTQDGIDEDLYDVIIKSPGIKGALFSDKITSMTELFLREFRDQTVGITGTKGKSTTAAMIHHVLESCGRDSLLVGNIGKPCLDYYDLIRGDTVLVFEMSCHQLEHIHVSPHIAVFLNLYEEHLDHYGTFEKYFQAKAGITASQEKGDILFAGEEVPAVATAADVRVISGADLPEFDMKLRGRHNRYNARFVYDICTGIYGCGAEETVAAICDFGGLRHRLEFAGTFRGVDYYDDSISTIPEATIAAALSVDNTKTLLIGGMDRNIDYSKLTEFAREHAEYNYIFMYSSGERIYSRLGDLPYCYYRGDLAGAVDLAKEITGAGSACILSPAAASYGYFKDFEERGDVFRELVSGKRDR